MLKANDQLHGYTGTESWYPYMSQTLLTDGVKALATKFECWWFVDIVASYQPQLRKKGLEYQYWTLNRHEGKETATVSCWSMANTTNPKHLVLKQEIAFTTFKPDFAEIWLKNDVLLLPSED